MKVYILQNYDYDYHRIEGVYLDKSIPQAILDRLESQVLASVKAIEAWDIKFINETGARSTNEDPLVTAERKREYHKMNPRPPRFRHNLFLEEYEVQ